MRSSLRGGQMRPLLHPMPLVPPRPLTFSPSDPLTLALRPSCSPLPSLALRAGGGRRVEGARVWLEDDWAAQAAPRERAGPPRALPAAAAYRPAHHLLPRAAASQRRRRTDRARTQRSGDVSRRCRRYSAPPPRSLAGDGCELPSLTWTRARALQPCAGESNAPEDGRRGGDGRQFIYRAITSHPTRASHMLPQMLRRVRRADGPM